MSTLTRLRLALAAILALMLSLLVAAPATAAKSSPPATCSAGVMENGNIAVTWSAPTNPNGIILDYKVREHGFSSPVLTEPEWARGTVWTNALRDTATPQIQVRARNASGASDPCIAEVRPYEPPPPPPDETLTVDAGPDQTVERPNAAVLDGTITEGSNGAYTEMWSEVSGPGDVTFADPSEEDTTATFSQAGTYVLRLSAFDGEIVSDDVTITVTDPVTPPPPSTYVLPYTEDSFFKSEVAGAPIDQTLTAEMHHFMATYVGEDANDNQSEMSWPQLNLNPNWSGHNYVHRASKTAPVWKLTGTSSGTSNTRLDIVRTQGVHMPDDIWDTVPTGEQDRLLVVQDHVFGYTVQCADVAPNKAARTWTATNCGIMWHTSNGLDYRNPRSDDQRNFTSRGRIIDAMQVPREELDAAVAEDRGLGRVMHFFWVATEQADGFSHPMVNEESNTGGWGGEGWRLRIKPSVDLEARGLTGHALAIARTLQDNGAYIGDNSGSRTQLKIGPPEDYVGTNLTENVFQNKIFWTDFEVVEPGWQ